MNLGLRRYLWLRGATALALVVALFAQALIPAGWMPTDVRGDGSFTLTICSAESPVPPGFGGNHNTPDAPSDNAQQDAPCAFAALPAALPDVSAPVFAPPAYMDRLTSAFYFSVRAGVFSGPPLGSRAPPALV